jgi:hypothetical protein
LPAFMRSYFRRTQLFMSQKMWGRPEQHHDGRLFA